MWDIALLKLWDWCTFIQSTLSYFAPPHESIMTKSVEVVQIFLEDIGPFLREHWYPCNGLLKGTKHP